MDTLPRNTHTYVQFSIQLGERCSRTPALLLETQLSENFLQIILREHTSRLLPLCPPASKYCPTHLKLDKLWCRTKYKVLDAEGSRLITSFILLLQLFHLQPVFKILVNVWDNHIPRLTHMEFTISSGSPCPSHAQRALPHSPPQDVTMSHPFTLGTGHTLLVTQQLSDSCSVHSQT